MYTSVYDKNPFETIKIEEIIITFLSLWRGEPNVEQPENEVELFLRHTAKAIQNDNLRIR